jgi:hypothetical protein
MVVMTLDMGDGVRSREPSKAESTTSFAISSVLLIGCEKDEIGHVFDAAHDEAGVNGPR